MPRERYFGLVVERCREVVFEEWGASKATDLSDEAHRAVAKYVAGLIERMDRLDPEIQDHEDPRCAPAL